MRIRELFGNLVRSGPVAREALASGNLSVLRSMLGPAWRGLILRRAHGAEATDVPAGHSTRFDWSYARELPEMRRLYEAAKVSQWNASHDLDWSVPVDPHDEGRPVIPEDWIPVADLQVYRRCSTRERNEQRHALAAWMLSQFLHGEQGALYASAQVTEAVPWLDGKLYGSTQVVDEARHVEAFHGYLTQKLEKLYVIDDNLYVVVDALMSDSRWDLKFLGMQIMIEGLALGAFGTIRQVSREPLLKDLLKYVITDEARHVHYGVLALAEVYTGQRYGLSEPERREREDWAFEVSLMLRNRFLAHEFYDEFYAHAMTRREWDAVVHRSPMMTLFRRTMFKRIIPNLKRIGLLSERVRARYAELGLLEFEHGKAATELTAADLLDG